MDEKTNVYLPVYVYTFGFNAEKTIRRCVESVLNQTYSDFIYIIRDNGSTDATYDILKEYAKKDDRIQLFRNNTNNHYTDIDKEMQTYIRDINFNRMNIKYYFCMLDADDEYTPNFLEDAINFAGQECLDIVIGGTMLINDTTFDKINRSYKDKCVITGNDFDTYFTDYHWYTRQVWGKLYKSTILDGGLDWMNNILENELGVGQTISYGSDTLQTLYRFGKSKRIGVLPGIYHNYYIHPKSSSYKFDPNRIKSDRILHKYTMEFLEKKVGYISPNNQSFIYCVLLEAIKDTIVLLTSTDIDVTEKFKGLRDIFSDTATLEVLGYDGVPIEERIVFVENVFNAIKEFSDTSQYEDAIWLGLNLSALLERQSDYIKYSKMSINWLIKHKRKAEARHQLGDWDEILPDDADFRNFRRKLDSITE